MKIFTVNSKSDVETNHLISDENTDDDKRSKHIQHQEYGIVNEDKEVIANDKEEEWEDEEVTDKDNDKDEEDKEGDTNNDRDEMDSFIVHSRDKEDREVSYDFESDVKKNNSNDN